jgi:hypothetical protein
MPVRRFCLLASLAALLAACGPNTQVGDTTRLDGPHNVQQAGVIVPQEGQRTTEVAAARARIPYQYREKRDPNLFAFGFNLNPGSNRSTDRD